MINQKFCEFCQIILEEQQAYKVFENKKFIAFLDKHPLFKGHCLLLPKHHIPTLDELPVKLIRPLFELVQLLAKAIKKGTESQGSFIAMNNRVSQSVPHFHIHIIPRNKKDGLKGFFWPRTTYKDEIEMRKIQSVISLQISILLSKK